MRQNIKYNIKRQCKINLALPRCFVSLKTGKGRQSLTSGDVSVSVFIFFRCSDGDMAL